MRVLSILLAVLLLPALVCCAEAAETPSFEIDPSKGLEPELAGELGPFSGQSAEGFFDRLYALLQRTLARSELFGIPEALRSMGLILAAAMLGGLLRTRPGAERCADLAFCLAVAGACAGNVRAMIALGAQTVEKIHEYLRLLLPGMTTLMLSSGSGAAAGATSALAGVGFTLLLRLISGLLVPLLYLFIALSTAEAMIGQAGLAQLRDFAKWCVVSCLKGVLYGFSACLALTGVFAGSVDAQRLKAARLAVSGMVPVVGNLVSGVSGSLLCAADALKSSVGAYGMLAVLAICLTPFLKLGVQYLMLKLSAAICGLFGQGGQTALVQKMAEAMGLMLAMTGVSCILALLTLTLCVRASQPWLP